MSELSRETLEDLLGKAHNVVTWTTQGTIKSDAAGTQHLIDARQRYFKARIDACAAAGRQLTISEFGGCTCGWKLHTEPDYENCMYHYSARLQPDNHRIPWNCPTYYDGCNCEKRDD